MHDGPVLVLQLCGKSPTPDSRLNPGTAACDAPPSPPIAPHLIACLCLGAKERYFQEKERLDHALAVLREGAEKVCILCYAAHGQR